MNTPQTEKHEFTIGNFGPTTAPLCSQCGLSEKAETHYQWQGDPETLKRFEALPMEAKIYSKMRPSRKQDTVQQQETTAEHLPLPRLTLDECPDANGFSTLRPYDGSRNGDTDIEPIATVYDVFNAALIVKACNEYKKVVAQRDRLKSMLEVAWRLGATHQTPDFDTCNAWHEAINASKPADPFTDEKLHEMGCSYDREQIDGGE